MDREKPVQAGAQDRKAKDLDGSSPMVGVGFADDPASLGYTDPEDPNAPALGRVDTLPAEKPNQKTQSGPEPDSRPVRQRPDKHPEAQDGSPGSIPAFQERAVPSCSPKSLRIVASTAAIP